MNLYRVKAVPVPGSEVTFFLLGRGVEQVLAHTKLALSKNKSCAWRDLWSLEVETIQFGIEMISDDEQKA